MHVENIINFVRGWLVEHAIPAFAAEYISADGIIIFFGISFFSAFMFLAGYSFYVGLTHNSLVKKLERKCQELSLVNAALENSTELTNEYRRQLEVNGLI